MNVGIELNWLMTMFRSGSCEHGNEVSGLEGRNSFHHLKSFQSFQGIPCPVKLISWSVQYNISVFRM
jgi:hypothetical protein